MFNQTITAYTHSIPTSWGKSWQAEEVPVSAVLTLSHGKSSIVYKKVVSKSIAVSKLKDFMNNTYVWSRQVSSTSCTCRRTLSTRSICLC